MSTSIKSKGKRPADKPRKPRGDFPLFPHQRGYWAKKVRGRLRYFGKVADDPKGAAALDLWLDQKDDLLAGRTPRVHRDGLILKDMINRFLSVKFQLLETRELSKRTFDDYHATCERLLNQFGMERLVDDLGSDDFEALRATLGKTWGPVAVGNEVNRIRVVFKYAFDARLINQPVRFGPLFRRPSRRVLRRARAEKGPKMLEAAEIRKLLDKAAQPVRAMILLGINCALGNSDVGQLEQRHLDLHRGWLDYPRPKTGVDRRVKLWPETVKAIRESLDKRPKPKLKEHADLVFVTRLGAPWAKDIADSPVGKEFNKLLVAEKIKRPGVSFYALRHTFETIGGEAKDQVAVNAIMGHVDSSMAGAYRERISDDRLKAVTDHVRSWLYPRTKKSRKNAAN